MEGALKGEPLLRFLHRYYPARVQSQIPGVFSCVARGYLFRRMSYHNQGKNVDAHRYALFDATLNDLTNQLIIKKKFHLITKANILRSCSVMMPAITCVFTFASEILWAEIAPERPVGSSPFVVRSLVKQQVSLQREALATFPADEWTLASVTTHMVY